METEESFVEELLKALNAQSQILFLLMGILLVLILVLIFSQIIQLISTRNMFKAQNDQFNKTLDVIKSLSFSPAEDKGRLIVNMPGLLPTDPATAKADLVHLADECVALGEKIDEHTDRRNNSKLVSELVYKIATRLDLDNETCTLYFCASMVYDIGFLDVPAEYFRAEILNSTEKRILRSHVNHGKDHLGFVDEKYRKTFENACTYHHENLDGTGYPESLKDSSIPVVARIIHVVESYISLVNPRSYHKILDKQSAISELQRQKGIYDPEIIEALASII